jgi:Protein of unknown function (DUF1326)
MAWNLEGSYFETCSCEFMCPCNASFSHGATHDRCRVTLVFNITDGEVEGTDVSGLTVAAVADTPKVMTDGNWRLGMFIEDGVPFGVETGEPARLRGIFHPVGSDFAVSEAMRSKINAFGIEYEGKSGLSSSRFAWAA